MNTDRVVLALAGAIVLISLALGQYVHPYWYALTAFIAGMIIETRLTDTGGREAGESLRERQDASAAS